MSTSDVIGPRLPAEESAHLLRPRVDVALDRETLAEHAEVVHELNRGFIGSPSFRQLADTTVYVAGRAPTEIAAEVVERWPGTTPKARTGPRPQASAATPMVHREPTAYRDKLDAHPSRPAGPP